MNINELFEKYKDVIPYLVFGVLTTAVNIASYWVCAHPFNMPVMVSTVIAWILSVLFAYITNRKWVFHSVTSGFHDIFMEIVYFFCARLATGIFDWSFMFIFVDMLNLNDMFIKVVSNVIVVVLNYIASKLFIFKKK